MSELSVPGITVSELARALRSADAFVLLDVREPIELQHARIVDSRLATVPMSLFSRHGISALPEAATREARIYVLCHHGNRSAEVTRWLAAQGWKNVHNVMGGIDQYARMIDRNVGFY